MLIDRLYKEVKEKSPICVGLDTKFSFLPTYLQENDMETWEKLYTFNRMIVDATIDLVACYKVQIACYEALGLEGLKAYAKTLEYVRSQGKIVIADVKRGDISSTAEMYAQGHFTGDFEADFLTVNPYMGLDAISPYFKYLESGEKGLFVLDRTSNPSSKDFQELDIEGKPLYMEVAKKIEEWGASFRGECGYSLVGSVVGLTYPQEFLNIREQFQNTFYLIPGYGAQGGTGEDLAHLFRQDLCAVVNSSRGIIAAHKGKVEDENFVSVVREKTLEMKEDILKWLR